MELANYFSQFHDGKPHKQATSGGFPDHPSLSMQQVNRLNATIIIDSAQMPLQEDELKKYALGNRQHRCPYCEKVMKGSMSNFRYHLLTHTGERPFCCPHCDYRAAVRHNVRSHIIHKHADCLWACATLIVTTGRQCDTTSGVASFTSMLRLWASGAQILLFQFCGGTFMHHPNVCWYILCVEKVHWNFLADGIVGRSVLYSEASFVHFVNVLYIYI